MGWKLGVPGAGLLVLAVLSFASGGPIFGSIFLFLGVLLLLAGVMMHVDRRTRELSRQLAELGEDMRRSTLGTGRRAGGNEPRSTKED